MVCDAIDVIPSRQRKKDPNKSLDAAIQRRRHNLSVSLALCVPPNKHSIHTLHTFSLLCPFVEANSTHYTKKTRSGLDFEGEYPQVTGHFLNSLEVSRRFSYLSLSRIVRHPENPAARTESEGGGSACEY